MSHEIYTTKGFIISAQPRGEADRLYLVFSESLGLVRATAQGVRKIGSKLRYALQEFSCSEISLVRGKHGWRIVGARPETIFSQKIEESPSKVRALRLLKSICPEDEPEPRLFSEIVAAFRFMDSAGLVEDKDMEALLVLKILSVLGYWGDEGGQELVASPWSEASLAKVAGVRRFVMQELNKSLRATQLL